MSYLSTTENVGFSGIPQNISDSSCATQYKMAVEGVPASCSEVNMFIHDSSGDEQSYIPHLNDNYFHTKFKIDPNELYTFHDSDVIAGEITVSHTEDNFIFIDNDAKSKLLDSPNKEIDLISSLTNGEVKEEIKKEFVSNGHYSQSNSVAKHQDVKTSPSIKDNKNQNTKVIKAKTQSHSKGKEQTRSNNAFEIRGPSVHSPKGQSTNATSTSTSNKASIISDNSITSLNNSKSATTSKSASETFLDVFKREQGLVENPPVTIKTESPSLPAPPAKIPTSTSKKSTSAGKTPSQPKVRRGRGPAVHEALQRISGQKRAIPQANKPWHAPGDDLFQLGPLDDKRPLPFTLESSSSDDDNMPDFEAGTGPVCVEESATESRGARLALRRAALRRHVARAHTALKLASDFRRPRALATLIKKQIRGQGAVCRVPTATVNHLLALRGMNALLAPQERRRLREAGWAGGESGRTDFSGSTCAEDRCTNVPLPCARYCFKHVTMEPEQRLYAACAAVFAGGARCMQPVLPLQDQTPLCTEHAWKRDNYDKLRGDMKPKKPVVVRARAWPPPPRTPRRPKRRRRPPPQQKQIKQQPRPEISVCSNSSAYDSSEDTNMGALSENEYITAAGNSHGLEVEVGQVPPDDILDPAVLSQIPDEAFTEFFNQAEGATPFAESSELAAALEAVLDERALDTISDCVFTPHQITKAKIQQVPTVSMESGAPS